MFAPAQMLDPSRVVHGTRNARYDCPDLAALDRHISRLRRHMTDLGSRMPEVVDGCRADIDRLLDRRSWLMLRVAERGPTDDRRTFASAVPARRDTAEA